MSLRQQLLAVGLLTLALPWMGLRYVQEMEAALRLGLEQALTASAMTIAASLSEPVTRLCNSKCARPGTVIYATTLATEPELDGVRDDNWSVIPAVAVGTHDLWVGTYERFAYVYVAVRDSAVVYQRQPGKTPYGDRIVLALERTPSSTRWLVLNTAAPGVFRAQETGPDRFEPSERYDERVIGAWQETGAGYALEVRVPLALIGDALGVGVIDVDPNGSDYAVELAATWDTASGAPGPFVRQRDELQRVVTQFAQPGGRLRVLDSDGWVLASAGSVAPRSTRATAGGVVGDLFRWLLEREDAPPMPEQPPGHVADERLRRALAGESTTVWYGGGPEREAIVAAAVPVAAAAVVVLEQASDPILTLTNQALVRLMTLTLLASFAVGLVLFGYATWLSLRVQRLAHAAQTALGPRGEIDTRMPGGAARDELGTLARSFGELLERLHEHTQYLRTLASKLSHELRTPLAVVTTSLDNLEHEVKAPAAGEYLGRLRQGAARLDAILAAMSEATVLEQAIRETTAVAVDVGAVVKSCCEAYRDVYREHEIDYRAGTTSTPRIMGSGELLAQLLDKLVDNAASFSAPASRIEVTVADDGSELVLSVTNRGPTLPAAMRGRLFDSLVSLRERGDGKPHLGLGLHIVALVADFHGGRCSADDLPDGTGVVFRVWFPRA